MPDAQKAQESRNIHLTPEIRSSKMAQMLQKAVFALPGCQRMSVNTLLCDTLGLADICFNELRLRERLSSTENSQQFFWGLFNSPFLVSFPGRLWGTSW